MSVVYHALCLNLHQPAGNLEQLLAENAWEAKEILYALDRMPRALWPYADVARVHLSLSGTLLETLSSPAFQRQVYGTVDCGALLWYLQNPQLFHILGTGYYHPVLPLIPEADRDEHLGRWHGIARHLFWRDDFPVFWPPEMAFSMELIPLLVRHGYRAVVVDSEHVEPVGEMSWHDLRYRPHVARFGDAEIIVVVRDRDLSDAQEAGMEPGWFEREVVARTQWCDVPPLIVTATDGENGGWFRNTTEGANFWTAFYREVLERARTDRPIVKPTFIPDYIARYGTHGEVRVRTGAWNTGWHHGRDFTQWTGSQRQRDAMLRLATVSRLIHDARWHAGERHEPDPAVHRQIEDAMWRLLRAETSCNFYWGEAWVDRCHADLDAALEQLAPVLPKPPEPPADFAV